MDGGTPRRGRSRSSRLGWRRLAGDERGAIGVMFALTLLPVAMVLGVAIDYGAAAGQRARLNAIADEAALAAVLVPNGEDAAAAAKRVFTSHSAELKGVTVTDVTARVGAPESAEGTALAAEKVVTVGYTATAPTAFAAMMGVRAIDLSGTSQAAKPLPQFIDFYILVDVSASMGLAATPQDAQRQFNRKGCAFACHWGGSGSDYLDARSQNPPITFRIDAVKYAITSLIADAQATQKVPGQFRVGVYPFVQCVGTLAPLSANLASVAAKVAGMPFDDGNYTAMPSGSPGEGPGVLTTTAPSGTDAWNCPGARGAALGSGGTRLDGALSVLPQVPRSGDGTSAAKARAFVFLLSDGAQDNSWSPWFINGNQDRNRFQAINPDWCRGGDANGVTVGVLNLRYLPLTTNQDEAQVQVVNERIANNEYANSLRRCASWNSFYFEASYGSEIDGALGSLFKSAVLSTRLTR